MIPGALARYPARPALRFAAGKREGSDVSVGDYLSSIDDVVDQDEHLSLAGGLDDVVDG